MTRTTKHAVALATTVLTGLALTACGDEGSGSAEDPSAGATSTSTGSESPTEEPTETSTETPTGTSTETPTDDATEEPAGPACADVWVAGQVLPERYAGCQDTDRGTWVQAMVYRCSSGQRLVTYQRTFYAAKGGAVVESDVPLARNPEFQRALETCGA